MSSNTTPMSISLAVITLFSSCCINVFFLEQLTKDLRDCGSVLLFLQFLFIACEGFISNRKFGRERRHVPLWDYAVMVSLFFISNATNSLALEFNVPMPLHMIFKSGSLAVNMLLGAYLLKRSYNIQKYIAVALVTIGILICTYTTGLTTDKDNLEGYKISRMSVGVVLLLVSLLVSARTGIYQETLSLKYGKHSEEALFYNHALPLPLFLLLSPSILKNLGIFNSSEPARVVFISDLIEVASGLIFPSTLTFKIPILWQYVVANVITQYFCIRSVFYLISQCSSLTVTLLLTLRKFLSLICSVLYFQNHFTPGHWVGATFVFAGSLMYADVFRSFKGRTQKISDGLIENMSTSSKRDVKKMQ